MIIVTRPLSQGEGFAQEVRALGHEVMLAPMLEVRGLAHEQPDLSGYAGVIFTSMNGVRFYKGAARGAAYCVGGATAEAARQAGFDPVYSADGTAEDLQEMIAAKGDGGLYLYVCGRDVIHEMEAIKRDKLVVYEADLTEHLSPECISALKEKRVQAVSFFSKRTAENFVRLVSEGALEESLVGVRALCISQNVIGCVRPELWASTYSAQTPDIQGMRALLELI